MKTPQVGTRRMVRPSKLNLGSSACRLQAAMFNAWSCQATGVLQLIKCQAAKLQPNNRAGTHLQSVLQREQLLRDHREHLNVDAVELVKASPSSTLSKPCRSESSTQLAAAATRLCLPLWQQSKD